MNLETLLEAAKYVEYSSKAKARGEEPHDYNTFGRLHVHDEPRSHHKAVSCKPDLRETIITHPDTSKERRRLNSGSLIHKDLPIFNEEVQGAGTREVHNKLEKNRRAHLKECFEELKKQLPNMDERKTSNLSILRGALRYIQTLKRKEREYEHEMERLAREKIAAQQKLAALKKELSSQLDHIDINVLLPDADNETTTTASECGQLSDVDDDDDDDDDDDNDNDIQNEISSTSHYHNSSSSEVTTSPASSVKSNTATSDGMSGTITVASISADDTISVCKSVGTSLTSQMLTTMPSSPLTTTSVSSVFSTVCTAASVSASQNIPKIQASMTSSPLTSGTSLLHSSSGNQSNLTSQISLPSQITATHSFQVGSVTGMLTNPHTVQVITQPGSVKVITTPNPLSGGASIGHPASATQVQNGPLHILTSTASLMALGAPAGTESSTMVTSSPKTSGTQSLVRVAPISGVSSAKQLMSPVTLVAPQAVVGVTQVATATKSIIINQMAGLTGLASSSAVTATSNSVMSKPTIVTSSSVTTSSSLTSKGSNQIGNSLPTTVTSQSNVITALQTAKPLSHIVQSGMTRNIATSQVLSTAVPAPQMNSVGRHIVTAAIKSVSPATRSQLSQLSGVAHVTHVMSQAPVAASVGHIVSAGNHVSAVTPLVAPMSVVSHSATVHHSQVYTAQSQQLGKVIASPVLKPVGQIPILQQQFLQPAVGSVTAQPVVVVSMAPASNGPQTSVVTSSNNKQSSTVSIPVTQ